MFSYTALHAAIEAASLISSGVPDPGSGVAPPGSESFLLILRWAAWIMFGVCVLATVLAGGAMALSSVRSRGGGGGEHAASLGWIFAGAIVVGSASALVGALV